MQMQGWLRITKSLGADSSIGVEVKESKTSWQNFKQLEVDNIFYSGKEVLAKHLSMSRLTRSLVDAVKLEDLRLNKC